MDGTTQHGFPTASPRTAIQHAFQKRIEEQINTVLTDCLGTTSFDDVLAEYLYQGLRDQPRLPRSLTESKEPLRQKIAARLEEDRKAMLANAEYARRRSKPQAQLIEKPAVVAVAWDGQLPEQPPERTFILTNNT